MDDLNKTHTMLDAFYKLYSIDIFDEFSKLLKGEAQILNYILSSNSAEVTPSLLSEKLCVTKARITSAISSLKRKEYILTEVSKNDKRKIIIKITQKGKFFIDSKFKKVESGFESIIKKLGDGNSDEIIRIINLLSSTYSTQT